MRIRYFEFIYIRLVYDCELSFHCYFFFSFLYFFSQASEQQHTELRKVSSVLSLLTSPNSSYIPQNNPLDEKTEQAKQSLIQLLEKDFRTLVGSPDEQTLNLASKS